MPRTAVDDCERMNDPIRLGAKALVEVSERDFQRVLELLENPPKPNAKLRAVARALAKSRLGDAGAVCARSA